MRDSVDSSAALKSNTAQQYLLDRGISAKQIKAFQVGYFPSGMRNVNRFAKAMAAQNILLKDLIECHIMMEGKAVYSPFEERILFPIADHIGRFCGFGGRVFKKEDERAKYYNSKESDFFSKGKLLFGLDKAKKAMQKSESAFLVEGYMDCLAMVQHGYPNTVAALGTACTIDHLKMLARHASILHLLYDGDKAGQKAILRIAQMCWQVNVDLKVVQLPADQDPDSFLKGGGDLDSLVEKSQDIFSFFINSTVGNDFLQRSLSQKLDEAQKVVELVGSIPDVFKQDLLLHQAASAMQMPFQTVKDLFKARNRAKASRTYQRSNIPTGHGAGGQIGQKRRNQGVESGILLEEKIFSVILNGTIGAGAVLDIELDLIPYFSPTIRELLKKLYALVKEKTQSSDFFTLFMDSLDESEQQLVSRISIEHDSPMSREGFNRLIFCFCKSNWKNIVKNVKQEILKAKKENDSVKLSELFGRFSRLKQKFLSKGLV